MAAQLEKNNIKYTSERKPRMAYRITDKCIKCGSCNPFCKNDAIIEEGDRFAIDESKCDDCGTCIEYCPIDEAIVKIDEKALIG
jgi:MinD superfamily P-loop ATPase